MSSSGSRVEYTGMGIVKGIVAEVSFSLAFTLALTALGYVALLLTR